MRKLKDILSASQITKMLLKIMEWSQKQRRSFKKKRKKSFTYFKLLLSRRVLMKMKSILKSFHFFQSLMLVFIKALRRDLIYTKWEKIDQNYLEFQASSQTLALKIIKKLHKVVKAEEEERQEILAS